MGSGKLVVIPPSRSGVLGVAEEADLKRFRSGLAGLTEFVEKHRAVVACALWKRLETWDLIDYKRTRKLLLGLLKNLYTHSLSSKHAAIP